MNQKTLYARLGGYDGIAAMVNNLMPRLRSDALLGHFWQRRPEDSLKRSKQLLIDFLCSSAGGPVYYAGRTMKTSHQGMRLSEADWSAFLGHLCATLDVYNVAQPDRDALIVLVQSTKTDMVEA